MVMAPLIPKKGPGYRDIAIFPGITRLCTKARVPITREWEIQHDRSYFAAGVARGAPDVVWRAAVRAESACTKGGAAAAI
eukprot:7285334-Karenia_brevis.AAC.1